jgi:hypothetical protein
MTLKRNFTIDDLQQYLDQIKLRGDFHEVILTDDQGLVLCSTGEDTDRSEKQAAFFTVLKRFAGTAAAEMNLSVATELSLVDETGDKLVIRPFSTNESELVLAFKLKNQNARYKRLLAGTIHAIQSVWDK